MIKKTAFALLLCALSAHTMAKDKTAAVAHHSGYNQDAQGNITRSDFGLCWRSGSWTPEDAIPGCDGALKPPIPNPIAPDVIDTRETSAVVPTTIARCDFSVILQNDQTFAFGQSTLNNQAHARIKHDVIDRLSHCSTIESVVITGHTDRIGSTTANQRLSEQRANAVAVFLQKTNTSLPITIIGAGSTNPVSDCNAKMSKKQQINCLAPNRRVEVQVKGKGK